MNSSLWKRPLRARGMVEATRRLFAALALASLTFTFLVRLTAARDTLLLVALASAAVLGLSWCAGYVRKGAPWGLDVVDAMAILTFALASQEPGATAGFVFAALWFRSLYGSMRRSLLRALLYVGALSATVPLWTYVPGHIGDTDIAPLAGVFPVMFVTAIVGQLLGESLRAREQDALRDMAHASAGSELLGVTDAAEIDRIAWTAIAGVCAATPGLRALKVFKEGSGLRVEAATGGFAFLPKTLPGTALAVPGGPGRAVREPTDSTTELDEAAGTPCAWACLSLPDRSARVGEAWLLLGSPQRIPARAIETIGECDDLATACTRLASIDGPAGRGPRP